MFQVLSLTVLFVSVNLSFGQTNKEIQEKCYGVFQNLAHVFCCNNVEEIIMRYRDNFLACKSMPFLPPACEFHNCMGNELGIALADGKIDKAKLAELTAKELSDFPGVSETILDKCVNGDLTLYGEPDDCDIRKLVSCYAVQIYRDCPDWSESGHCKMVKKEASECTNLF